MADVPPSKPFSVAMFEIHRPHLTDFVRDSLVPAINDPTIPLILVNADVKVGKREMMEYAAMRDAGGAPNRAHLTLSAFHRVADKNQREELKKHGIKVYPIKTNKDVGECVTAIRALLNEGRNIVIHLDECDYGSGDTQLLSNMYSYLRARENAHNVTIILYSATPYEVLFSADVGQHQLLDEIMHGTVVVYNPPPGYCGAERFLAAGLVENATEFFTFDIDGRPRLTEQGRQIVAQLWVNARSGNGRNILMLRLSGGGRSKKDKALYKFIRNLHLIPELGRGGPMDLRVYVDKEDSFGEEDLHNRWIVQKIDWANPQYWNGMRSDVPIIFVHDQTASRSTELASHGRVYAIHDYRTTIDMAAFIQAVLRVAHYESKYGGFQPIRIYAHKPTLEYHARRITFEQWVGMSQAWSMVQVQADGPDPVFEIQDSEGNVHPQHPAPMPERRAKEVLSLLGCGVELSLSSRVTKPSTRSLPIFGTYFFPTRRETFGRDIERVKRLPGHELFRDHNFENPFESAVRRAQPPSPDGREIGWLRTWGVWDYDRHIDGNGGGGSVTMGGPRLTICYKDGVLGVAVRWHTQEFEDIDPARVVRVVRSMYPSLPRGA